MIPVLPLEMDGIPVRYKRVTAPLNETARARLCESSGSERSSPEDSPELADLVDSFYDNVEEESGASGEERRSESGGIGGCREMLKALLAELGSDSVAGRIRAEAEAACRVVGSGSDGFKRRVMSQLRDEGFDAGLCKSRWEKTKTHRFPAGDHEYIDVISEGGTRYIVEPNLLVEFDIARPTTGYLALLNILPEVFVGRPDMLKGLVRLMCVAAKESLKGMGMPVPPWRRREYVQGKWFSSYKRTTSRIPAVMGNGSTGSVVGFVGRRFCGVGFEGKEGVRHVKLGMALKGMYL